MTTTYSGTLDLLKQFYKDTDNEISTNYSIKEHKDDGDNTK